MADQFTPIQIQHLGLLAMAGGPYGAPVLPGLLAGATPQTRPAAAPKSDQKPFAGLFNMQGGYTPADIQKSLGDVAGHFQGRPTIPMWNGNRGVGNWLPTAGNFAQGALGILPMYLQQQNTRENERIRREAVDRASGATTLKDFVSAFRDGTPEQSIVAMQAHLQNLIKEQERERQAALMQQIYGGPPEAAAPAATAPAAPTAPTPATAQPDSMPPAIDFRGAGLPELAPNGTFGLPQPTSGAPQRDHSQGALPTLMLEAGTGPPPPSAGSNAPAGVPAGVGAAPPTTPAPQPPPAQPTAAPAQSEPIVQIGQFRLPLSEARRRAALGRAQGVDVKPLEDAIDIAETAEKKAGEARGTAQANMPQAMQAANSLVRNIDWLLDNQNRVAGVTGWQGQGWYDAPAWYNPLAYVPEGTSRADTKERIRQVTGQGFVQAFNSIKGAGPISDQEGAAASAAITRLENRGQSDEEYMQAVRDARREIWELMNVARAKAGQPPISYQPHATEARQGQGGGRPQQAGPTAPGNYVWTPDGGLQRR